MRDEPLRSAGIFAGKRHAHRGAVVRPFIYLTTNLITGPAIAIATRVTVLHYKIWNYAMNRDAVEVFALGELDEVIDSQGGFVRQQLDGKHALGRCDYGVHLFTHACNGTFVVSRRIASLHRSDSRTEIAGAVFFENRDGFTPDQVVTRIERGFDRVVGFGGFLFAERVENRKCRVVQLFVSHGYRQRV